MSENAAPNGVNEPKGGMIIAGRYQIDRLIARGGMAAVYLAHQVKLNRPVALKILTPPTDVTATPAGCLSWYATSAPTCCSRSRPTTGG